MAIILKIDKPKSCADCILTYAKVCPLTNNSVVNDIINNTLSKDCPLRSADEMIAEISVCKTENEMRIAERDYKSRLWISGIFSEIVGIIHKYCDKEQNNE